MIHSLQASQSLPLPRAVARCSCSRFGSRSHRGSAQDRIGAAAVLAGWLACERQRADTSARGHVGTQTSARAGSWTRWHAGERTRWQADGRERASSVLCALLRGPRPGHGVWVAVPQRSRLSDAAPAQWHGRAGGGVMKGSDGSSRRSALRSTDAHACGMCSVPSCPARGILPATADCRGRAAARRAA